MTRDGCEWRRRQRGIGWSLGYPGETRVPEYSGSRRRGSLLDRAEKGVVGVCGAWLHLAHMQAVGAVLRSLKPQHRCAWCGRQEYTFGTWLAWVLPLTH
jgi:hypothetical protein